MGRMQRRTLPSPMLRVAMTRASTEFGALRVTIGTARRTARRGPRRRRPPRSSPMLRDALTRARMESGALRATLGTARRTARSLKKRQSVMLRNARTRVSTVFGAKRALLGIARRIALMRNRSSFKHVRYGWLNLVVVPLQEEWLYSS